MSSSTTAPIRKSTRHCRLSQRAKEAIDSLPRSLLHSNSSNSSTSSSNSKKEYNINTPTTSFFSSVTDNTETITIKNDESPMIIDDSTKNSKRTRKPSWKAEEMEKQQQRINTLSPNKKKQLKRSSMSDDEDENNDIEANDKILSSPSFSKIRKIDSSSSSTHSLKTEMMLQRQKRLFQLELLKAQQNLNNDSSTSSSSAESSDEDNEDINFIDETINDKKPAEAQSPFSSISIVNKDDYDFIDDFALQDNDNDRFTKELHPNSPFSSNSSASLKHISTDDEEEEEDFEKYDYFDGAELFEKTAFSSEDEIEDVDFYQEKLSNINDYHHFFNEPIIPHFPQDNFSITSNTTPTATATTVSHDITNLPMEIDSSLLDLNDIKEINLDNIAANNFVITDAVMSQLIDNGNSLYSDITSIIKATLNNDLISYTKKPELEIDITNIEKEIAKVVECEVNNNNKINNNENDNDNNSHVSVDNVGSVDNDDFVIADLESPLKNMVEQTPFDSAASTNNVSPSINLAEKIRNLKDEEKKIGNHSSEQRWPLSPTDNSSSFNLLDTLLIKKKSSMRFQNLNNIENTYPITNNNNETSIDDFLNLTQDCNEEEKIEQDTIESDTDPIESPSSTAMETVEVSGSPNNSPKIGQISAIFNHSQNQDKSLPFGRISLDYRHQKQANLALVFNHENKSNLKNKFKDFKNPTKKALNKRAILSGRVYKEMVNTGASFGISEFLI
ncbi:hypothetical protein BVG19_g2866 [[Candida] boidinii]|nr:hypothetical protein BVG19_g2866 [[Candida] boidinii]OWB52758.1 hypothetical protein B5S27_g4339 [[Candida] boidinii]